MKTLLLLLTLSLFASADIGWKANSLTVEGVAFQGDAVDITSNGQIVAVGRKSALVLSSNSAVAHELTLTEPILSASSNGIHVLYLAYEDESPSHRIRIVDDVAISGGSGIIKLSGNWQPNRGDVLCLIYFAPDYRECGRSNN